MNAAKRKKRKVCGQKTRYASEEQAKAAAFAHMLWRGGGGIVGAYRCRYCQAWHIGHQGKGKVANL